MLRRVNRVRPTATAARIACVLPDANADASEDERLARLALLEGDAEITAAAEGRGAAAIQTRGCEGRGTHTGDSTS
jgi:hypothetical protein